MATVIAMPKLSATMDEATVVLWHKAAGEQVSTGDIILEIETDKATLTIEAPVSGYLGNPWVAVGESAAVGAHLVTILEEGEQEQISGAPNDSLPKAPALRGDGETVESRSYKSNEAAAGISSDLRLFASPLARRIARERGLDLKRLHGSGPNGRIVGADVKTAAAGRENNVRRQIAQEVATSRREIPSFNLTRWIDMEAVLSLVDKLERQISATDCLLYAMARAVDKVPQFRCVWNSENMIVEDILATNIGLVVSTNSGLAIPVLGDVGKLDIHEISNRRGIAVAAAREGRFLQTLVQRASISLSSLIREEADDFEAIISPGQSAILAVGRITERVVALDGKITVRRGCAVTLSVDHRAIDGRVGAKFIGHVARVLESLGHETFQQQ